MHTKTEKQEAFGRLLDIIDELREKCPWDRKQTMQSLRHLTLEESYELSDALLEEDMDEIKKELGDVFFSLINYSRIIGLNPDSALEKTNLKFISRFQEMEKLAQERNLVLSEMSLEQMDELWEEAKKNTK